MRVQEIMSKKPEYLPPTATLQEAAELMKDNDYGFIPIGENDRLIGAVTDRDITIRATSVGKNPTKTTIREIMTEGIEYCFEEDDLKEVVDKMERLQMRRLVVLNKDKRLTGILSLGDIATKCQDEKLCSELTEAVSEH